MFLTQHINHVERSCKQGFAPLTYAQFALVAMRIALSGKWNRSFGGK